jgi:signal transduction histidine kinase
MIIDSRYKVLNKLGTGLLATVFKVKDIRTDNIYALKLFTNIDNKSLYEKFSAEKMHHITKIQHSNLFHVIDFGNGGKHIYYIREFCEGNNLNQFRLRSGNIDQLYDIIIQTCYALSALHSQGIIHQDLKPTNIIYKLEKNEISLKVMDYGFTKIDVERKQQNVSSALPFIAPEIYLGEGAVPQSDFYSLGVILYKITTGVLPYSTDQISGFIAGDQFNLLPKFPRELNEKIPRELEKLIIRLLEKNPEDRYTNVKSIISFINRTRGTDYPYSKQHSIVNSIRFSDYLVRKEYAEQLEGYLPMVNKNNNGKIVVLKGGKGLGKTNTITLFRYKILKEEYYTFNYQCGPKHKDPFFALIKEFYFATENNKALHSSLDVISDKLREYLFESEDSALDIAQGKSELDLDFATASNFLFRLSEEKPLIFTIQKGEYLSAEVIRFLNYISNEISSRPIMIVLSINDPRSIQGLVHAVEVTLQPLSLDKTIKYVSKLLSQKPNDEFVKQLWIRSNGNPWFVEQILIDLTKKRIILKDSDHFDFNVNLDNYKLPPELMLDIKEKIEHLSEDSYKKLQKLALIKTPLNKDLCKYVLNIDDKEFFFFIKDCVDSEVMKEENDKKVFTFKEIPEYFIEKADKGALEDISQTILTFYHDKPIGDMNTLKALISHAEIIGDIIAIKRFNYQYLNLLIDENLYEKAFEVISQIIKIDFENQNEISIVERIRDLFKLIELSEWASDSSINESLRKTIMKLGNSTEKDFILGSYYMQHNKYSLAKSRLERAMNSCVTGKFKIIILMKLGDLYLSRRNYDLALSTINQLTQYTVPSDLKISIVNLQARYFLLKGLVDEGINLIEEFLPQIDTGNDAGYFVKLGKVHNTLAVLYRHKKNYSETIKNYHITRKIWEKVYYKRSLSTIYNNLGDIALVQGDTKTAIEFFDMAMKHSVESKNMNHILLTNLNYGEAYIKLGIFSVAEEYLIKAKQQSESLESRPFYDSIISNLANARSKVHNLNYYHSFIRKNAPHLIEGNFKKITPLEKSYFYYLMAIGNFKKIKNLLYKYKGKFKEDKEIEFYNQIYGYTLLANNRLDKARESIDRALRYSKQDKSVYAQMIGYLRLNEFYLALNEVEKAEEYCVKAKKLCSRYDFYYWEQVTDMLMAKTQLADPKVTLRLIIRKLKRVLDICRENNFFQLEIEIYGFFLQIYSFLKVKKTVNKLFKIYKDKIAKAAVGIPTEDRESWYHHTKFYLDNPYDLQTIKIVSRANINLNWEEELYSVVKLKEVRRIKFFINKVIMNLFSPDYYAIILFDELQEKTDPFLFYKINKSKLYQPVFLKKYEICKDSKKIQKLKYDDRNIVFTPLMINSNFIGIMVLADAGELEFQRYELRIMETLRLHLTAILLRINDFAELNYDMNLMHKMMRMTQKFFSIKDSDKLNQEIIEFTLDFIGASRGFFISKDENENYIYEVAMDTSKYIINKFSNINTDVISEVQRQKKPVHVNDVIHDDTWESESYGLDVYCAPVIVDHKITAYIYFDNLNNTDQELHINDEFMSMLHSQISVAYKNTIEYEKLKRKNHEIKDLDEMKNDFINIVSHELKTPLVTLKGYSNKLDRLEVPTDAKKMFTVMQKNINKLYYRINDIVNYSRYRQINKLETSPTDLSDVLSLITEELAEISKSRNMQLKTELEEGIPPVKINWEAFHLLIMNLGLNSIRFTKDFGTIVIGARMSAFQKEEINNKPSVVIYVQDNGIGIPEKELKNVFQKFYELNDIYSHRSGEIEYKSSGLGLGLATAELITELHKGKIWINSKENQGSTVFVAIPL